MIVPQIDHIVYVVTDLHQGIDHIQKITGAPVSPGGQHLNRGTHNALLKIGAQCYFEILAIDKSNHAIQPPRWMGVDHISEARITRWAIRSSEDIQREARILELYRPQYGKITPGSREIAPNQMLNWSMTEPGHHAVDPVPFLIDWKDSIHPTTALPQQCELISLSLGHPNPSKVNLQLTNLNVDLVFHESDQEYIHAELSTPNGVITL